MENIRCECTVESCKCGPFANPDESVPSTPETLCDLLNCKHARKYHINRLFTRNTISQQQQQHQAGSSSSKKRKFTSPGPGRAILPDLTNAPPTPFAGGSSSSSSGIIPAAPTSAPLPLNSDDADQNEVAVSVLLYK